MRRDETREGEVVSFEAVVRSETNVSMFDTGRFLTPENIENFIPQGGMAKKAAKITSGFGF